MRGLINTRDGTGCLSRAARTSAAMPSKYSARSSITASWIGSPICGAAKPTPGASRMVSCIHLISCCVVGVSISPGVSGRAIFLRTGSPTWTIFSFIWLIIAWNLHDLAAVLDRFPRRLNDELVIAAIAGSRHHACTVQFLEDLLPARQGACFGIDADT